MSWEVEYTDEFDTWWDELIVDEQVSLTASILLLEQKDQCYLFPIALESLAQSIHTCENLGFNTVDNHIEFFTHLIRVE